MPMDVVVARKKLAVIIPILLPELAVIIPVLFAVFATLSPKVWAIGDGGGGAGGGDGGGGAGGGYRAAVIELIQSDDPKAVGLGIETVEKFLSAPIETLVALDVEANVCTRFECGPLDEKQVRKLLAFAIVENQRRENIQWSIITATATAVVAIVALCSLILSIVSLRRTRRYQPSPHTSRKPFGNSLGRVNLTLE